MFAVSGFNSLIALASSEEIFCTNLSPNAFPPFFRHESEIISLIPIIFARLKESFFSFFHLYRIFLLLFGHNDRGEKGRNRIEREHPTESIDRSRFNQVRFDR